MLYTRINRALALLQAVRACAARKNSLALAYDCAVSKVSPSSSSRAASELFDSSKVESCIALSGTEALLALLSGGIARRSSDALAMGDISSKRRRSFTKVLPF